MREMNDDEKKVFDRKMDYIAKLKDSMTQEELDGILPRDITEAMGAPSFRFGDRRYYPRTDFNEYLESSFSGSTVSGRMEELEGQVGDLNEKLEHTKREADGYVAEIERLEAELKEAKAKGYRPSPDGKTRSVLMDIEPVEVHYRGEVNMLIESMFTEWLRNHRPQTPSENVRAYEIARALKDTVLAKADLREDRRRADDFRASIEKAVDAVYATTPTDVAPLLAIGFTNRTRKGSPHWKLSWADKDDYIFVIPKTPGDRNGQENCKRGIVSRLCIDK